MSEVITPRLMAAAKEFNIGTNTLIDFLISKSFSGDDLKPTTKLSEEMYRVLQSEFQGDKAAKQKAEQLKKKFNTDIILLPPTKEGNYRISYGKYSTPEEAESMLKSIRININPDAWIFSAKINFKK